MSFKTGIRAPRLGFETHSIQLDLFLGSGPKEQMSCRTQGGGRELLNIPPPSVLLSILLSILPSVLLSVPPISHQGLKLFLPVINLTLQAFQASNQLPPASNLNSTPQICPPDLQLARQASNQHSLAQICPPNLKSALQAFILPPSLQICLFGQRPQRGQSPVEHRGEFRDVRPSVLRGLLDG